jgi:N-terminal half of MaoC dehydratase
MASDFEQAVERLKARRGERLASWGPVTLDPERIVHFREALAWPVGAAAVPPAILMQLGNVDIDVTRDVRPHEQLDPGLSKGVNGGSSMTWQRALRVGELISGEVRIKDATVRTGKSGQIAIVQIETTFVDANHQTVASAERSTVYRGGAA